jgi:hypothetical protein
MDSDPQPPERDDALAILVGAGAAVAVVVARGCSRIGSAALKVTTTAGEGVLLVPVVGSSLRDLDRRWRSEKAELESKGSFFFNDVANRFLDRVFGAVDVTTLVLKSVDIDRIIQQVDLSTMARSDVVGVARYVVDELDLPEMIRQSSGTLAADTIEGLRLQGMNADSSLSRLIDRVLGRREGNAIGGEITKDSGTTAPLGRSNGADA